MEFVGASLRLRPEEWAEVAKTIGVEEAHLRTVVEVETSGHGYDRLGHPDFLFEPHIFYRELKGFPDKLRIAVNKRLAYPSWGGPGSYPKTVELRWAQFQQAYSLAPTQAIRSASWGLGQIMGSEYNECGYSSPEQMLTAFCESEHNQLTAMANLIKHRNLDQDLRRFPAMDACRHFALRYNGSGYARNNYHVKLQQTYNRWVQKLGAGGHAGLQDDILRMGSRGERVRTLQRLLDQHGYHLQIDAIFGNRTRDNVLAWKADNDMPLVPEMTPEEVHKLELSHDRPIAEERAMTTTAELKKESRIAQAADNIKKVAAAGITVAAGTEGASQGGLLDKAQEAADHVSRVRSIWDQFKSILDWLGITDLLAFAYDHRVFILCAVIAIGGYYGHKVLKARLEDKQTGKTV